MKKTIFLACAALVVSAAAMVGVKAYNRLQMSDFALANIEALSQNENQLGSLRGTCHDDKKDCLFQCVCGEVGYIEEGKGSIKTIRGICVCEREYNLKFPKQ